MRVLFLTHRLPFAPNRGDRIRAYHILRTLARSMEVHVVSLAHDEEEASQATRMSTFAASTTIVRVPRVRNLTRAALALPSGRPLTHVLLDAPDLQETLRRTAASVRPHIVMPYCSGMARLAMTDALSATPCVLDMVDVDSEKWRALANTTAPPRRWIYTREADRLSRFESAATRHAAATLVVNEREKQLLACLAPDARIHVIPNGVDVGAFRPPRPPAAAPHVVFCGVMNYPPNEEGAVWLAEAVWPYVRAARPDARLFLVGSDPTVRVRRLAERDRSIEITGSVPDVRPYLWDAAVGVAPLATARGIQNKVLEAIAAGLPCVVTPAVSEGLPEHVRPACPAAVNAERFGAEILQLLSLNGTERRAIASTAGIMALEWSGTLAALPCLLMDVAQSHTNERRPAFRTA